LTVEIEGANLKEERRTPIMTKEKTTTKYAKLGSDYFNILERQGYELAEVKFGDLARMELNKDFLDEDEE
jgi:hypothetical protein